MKRQFKTTGIVLILIIAGNLQLNAQRGMRGMMDTTQMNRPGNRMYSRQFRGAMRNNDTLIMRNMHPGMRAGNIENMRRFRAPAPAYGMRRGIRPGQGYGMLPRPGSEPGRFGPGPMYGMRGGMNRMPADRPGLRPDGPGMMRINNIPDLTDKQRKEIADLRQKQESEMKKMRDEMTSKMQEMREANRKKILDLLTDEQKKSIDIK